MARRNLYAHSATVLALVLLTASAAKAVLLTNPDDPRVWQGATVGTFAKLFYGSNTAANRQKVIDNQLLDDGVFDPTGYVTASLMANAWSNSAGAGGFLGASVPTASNPYNYGLSGKTLFESANAIDNLWFQSSPYVGNTVFDLGFDAAKAIVFPVIDHAPLPNEAIESTVYLSNDLVNWTQAVVERVWLEGYVADTSVLWDGFAYAVGTGTNATFRYASITAVGPAALQPAYGTDDEINGLMGLRANFTAKAEAPEPGEVTLALLGLAFGLGLGRHRV